MTNDLLPASEFSDRFIEYMRNRMAVSFHKYGKVADAYPTKVDALKSLAQRVEKYRDTGNTEWLVDAANFAMIEFMCPSHLDAHFKGTDSGESPGRTTVGGRQTRRGNDDL